MDKEQFIKLLDTCYDQALKGIPKVSVPIDEFVLGYTDKYLEPKKAAKALIFRQKIKSATSGFVTGVAGFLTLPVGVPANLASVYYIQLRMIAAIAMIGGFDPYQKAIRSLCYACLSGKAFHDILVDKKLSLLDRIATRSIELMTGDEVDELNERIEAKLFAILGNVGVRSVVKTVPVVGGLVGSGLDFTNTETVADNAYMVFIEKKMIES